MWGILLCSWERRDVAELVFPFPPPLSKRRCLQALWWAVISDYFPSSIACHLSWNITEQSSCPCWWGKMWNFVKEKMTPTILERQLGTSCAAWMALFVLFHVRSKLARCLWSKMGGNAVKWCMMKCTCNWLRRAACQGNKWSPFFFDASLILSLRRKAPPPPTPPASDPPASDPLGCFDVGNQSLLWCRHDGNGGFTIIPHLIQSSRHQITSKDQQETAT